MSQLLDLPVKGLSIDLRNYRIVPQPNEDAAVHALISLDPEYFWALMESLLADQWLGTENILIWKKKVGKKTESIVKEGNRRIGALKIILGILPTETFGLPEHLEAKIKSLSKDWKSAVSSVQCLVFEMEDLPKVQRLVELAHAKGEKAGRLNWNSVGRARCNRDEKGLPEPALDLLENYLSVGRNLNADQRERWGGQYPLTVLAEAIRRLIPSVKAKNTDEVVKFYTSQPKLRKPYESLLYAIGTDVVGFPGLRSPVLDFAFAYGFPNPSTTALNASSTSNPTSAKTGSNPTSSSPAAQGTSGSSTAAAAAGAPPVKPSPVALATTDPRAVMRTLKMFTPRGAGREKVKTLLDEVRTLKLDKQAHAFCFLLRSMFEISAKCYCDDHKAVGGPSYASASGDDRRLVDILNDVCAHMVGSGKAVNRQLQKDLQGAKTELGNSNGVLSVTSMNQLIHNKKFSVDQHHIATVFHNVFPLLIEMNR